MPVSKVLETLTRGMIENQQRHAVISNNIANVNSPGYKKDLQVNRSFGDYLQNVEAPSSSKGLHDSIYYTPTLFGQSSITQEIVTRHDQGDMRLTGNKLDISINGKGFFAVGTEKGERYTRNGSFMLNKDNEIVNRKGEYILGVGGEENAGIPIAVNGNDITIVEDGTVKVDGLAVAKIKMVDFEDYNKVVKIGDSMFEHQGDKSAELEVKDVVLSQGYLEGSNVNSISETTTMITNSRHFELQGKMQKAIEGTYNRAITELGAFK